MSAEQQEQLTQALCKLGLSLYQAKIYSALASMGPSGVAEIQQASGVPRTKIYEVLDQLVEIGAVEFQSGRPIIYNALSPSVLVDRMRNSYLAAADDATRLLAEMQQTGEKHRYRPCLDGKRQGSHTSKGGVNSCIWPEKRHNGGAVSAEVMTTTSKSIFKSLIQKGVHVRVVCVLHEGQHLDEKLRSEDFIEFRKMSNSSNFDSFGEDITEAFGKMVMTIIAKNASLIIIDDQEAFIHMPDATDDSRSLGLTIKIPGLPLMQRILFERLVQHGTVRVK